LAFWIWVNRTFWDEKKIISNTYIFNLTSAYSGQTKVARHFAYAKKAPLLSAADAGVSPR
jgi:hypothetical protein